MQAAGNSLTRAFGWLLEQGFDERDLLALNPCVPGEFTLPDAYYVNSGSPRIVYRGTLEGTLPLVAGRWYLIPDDVLDRHPALRRDSVPVARAPRLIS
jgi:hypothetical protein